MRTTLNIQDHALELCKKEAAKSGKSLGEVVSEAVLSTYSTRPARRKRPRFELPTAPGGALQPGVDLDNWVELEDIMDGIK